MKTQQTILIVGLLIMFYGSLCAQTNEQKIAQLESRIQLLEAKVAALEKLLQAPATAPVSNIKKNNRTNWRSLQKGMSKQQVENLLGVADVLSAGFLDFWYYNTTIGGRGTVTFQSGKVTGWDEPSMY